MYLPRLLFCCLLLSSCDIHIETAGTINDRSTGSPIDGVQVCWGDCDNRWTFSGEDGFFYLSFIVGATFSPPTELPLVFLKEGYAPDTLWLPVRDTTAVQLQALP